MNEPTSPTTANVDGQFRSGICAVIGRPNVGKSTFVNTVVGAKVAITTPVPQTTRHQIRGVLTRDDAQIVFVDTPGIHKPKTALGNRLNDVANVALSGVDVILFVVDASTGVGRGDQFLANALAEVNLPVIVAVNKTDRIAKLKQLPAIAAVAELGNFDEIVPISGLKGTQIDDVVTVIVDRLPVGPPLYPSETITDAETTHRIAEVIREKAMRAMREEVPHSIAVTVEAITPGKSDGVTAVFASVHVERDSQKGMVIGHQGSVLSTIGTQARPEVEEILDGPVYLDLHVKVAKAWQEDAKQLDRFGY